MAPGAAASLNAAFKCWYVNSGTFVPCEDSPYWGWFYEPLRVGLGEDVRVSCSLGGLVVFHNKTGNKCLAETRHYDFMTSYKNLLWLDGLWRQVMSGQVIFEHGEWSMRWNVATNTKWAQLLNTRTEAVEKNETGIKPTASAHAASQAEVVGADSGRSEDG